MKSLRSPITCVLFVLIVLSKSAQSSSNETFPKNSNVLEKWIKIDKMLNTATSSLMKKILPVIMESSGQLNLSSQCVKESMQLFAGLRSLKKWAVQFIDSSGKIVDGLMSGTTSSLGVYDECINTVATKSRSPNTVLFRGKYCSLDIRLPLPPKTKRYRLHDPVEELKNFSGSEVMKFFADNVSSFYLHNIKMILGVCIPSGCTVQDIDQIAKLVAGQLYITVDVLQCEVKEKKPYSNTAIWIIFTWSLLGLLVAVGTFLEEYGRRRSVHFESKISRFFLAFSLITNFKKFTSTKTSNADFSCLHGMRYLSITWVIMGHSYFFTARAMYAHVSMYLVEPAVSTFMTQTITNSSLVMATFFLMSGMLLSYFTIKYVVIDKKKFDLKQYVIHRIWRVYPVYIFVSMFAMLTPMMGSGPIFKEKMKYLFGACPSNWWRNLLFINNFSHEDNQCLPHTWYIACDFQLYLLALLVLLPLMRSQRIGVILNVLVILLSSFYSGIITYIIDLPPTVVSMYSDQADINLFVVYTYENVLSNAGPYFIGILLGYILITKPKIEIPWKIEVLGWCLAVICSSSTLYASYMWLNYGRATLTQASLYASLYKEVWALSIAWMVFQCIKGRGGIINYILSWNAWKPLGKLVFIIYLVQPVVQLTYLGMTRTLREFTHIHLIMEFFGYLCISTLIAFVVNMMVESPFLALEELLFRRSGKTQEDKTMAMNCEISKVENGLEMKKDTITDEKDTEGIDNDAFNNKT